MALRLPPSLLALSLLPFGGLAAQSGSGWNATLTVQPFPSPFVADWQRNPQMALLNVIYTGTTPQDVHIVGYVRSSERGELARVSSTPMTFSFGPVTQIFTSADILEWRTVSRNQQYTDMVLRAGVMPEGRLEMCAEILTPQDALLARACSPFTIALPDPPQLIFPLNNSVVPGLQPVMQWTPVRAPVEMGVTYRVRAFEVFDGQTPAQAVTSNPPRLDAEVMGAPMLVYPIDALPLEDKKQYAWQVEALDAEGNRLARSGRASEIWTFRPGGPGRDPAQIAGVLPDVIDLIPGVARLKGLKTATVEEDVASYVLNGRVRLELLAPTAFEADVDATDVAIDKISLGTQPQIRAGSLGGSLGGVKIPEEIAGRFVTLNRIDYAPQSGLTLSGQLALPNVAAAPLTGTVQVTAAGLFGTLRATSPAGQTLAALGTDPVRLLIRGAEVTYPGARMEVSAGLELFKSDVDCRGLTATFDDKGGITSDLSCTPQNAIPLVGDGERTGISLLALSGTLAFDAAGAATYDITGAGQFRLDAGGSNCGASLEISVKNTGVTVPSFTPRCDANEGTANIGWLQTRLASLQMKKFSYAVGTGFDFELTVDLMPWMPAIPGFTLPTIAASITKSGFAIPAIDVTINRPPISVAGFGLAVKRVTLPAFTLSWDNWEARSASGFKFGFDADLTMPNLPGEAACFTAEPISITGAEISNGRFKARLAERNFTPACGVTLRSETRLASSDVGLTQVANSGVTQAGTTTGGGGGAGGGGGGGGGAFASWLSMAVQVVPDLDRLGRCTSDEQRAAFGAWKTGMNSDNPAQVFAWPPCLDRSDIDEWNAWEKIEQPLPPPPLVKAFEFEGGGGLAVWLQKRDEERAKGDEKIKKAYDEYQEALDNPPCDIKTVECRKRIDDLRDAWEKERKTERERREKSALEAALDERKAVSNCYAWERQRELMGVADTASGTLQVCDAARQLELYRNNVLIPGLMPPWYDKRTGQPIPGYTPDPREVRRWCDNGYRDAAEAYMVNERQAQLAVDASGGYGPVLAAGKHCVEQTNADLIAACKSGSVLRREHAAQAAGSTLRQAQMLELGELETGVRAAFSACMSSSTQTTAATTAGGDDGDYFEETRWTIASSSRPPPTADGVAVRLELSRVGGEFAFAFFPNFVVDKVPEVEGRIVLPGIFQCTTETGQSASLTSKLRLGPRGEINGSILGFVPACPINLGSVEVTVTRSEMTFSTESDNQQLILDAAVAAKFTAAAQPALASGEIRIDLIRGRILDGTLSFKGPITLALPKEKPVLSFTLQSAALDTVGIHIDGRGELNLGPGQTIGTTFSQVVINTQTAAIKSGTIAFDASFGLEVGITSGGQLDFTAKPRGAPVSLQSGIRLDLPSQISLGTAGFSASGDGSARLIYEGKDVDGLTARFSPNFAIGFSPLGVSAGVLDLQRNGVSMAYVDRAGFHPNLAYFASAIMPARLPLPTEAVAYLELRDAGGNLRVTTENTGQGIRLYTAAGQSVPLVVPALQMGRSSAPRLNVTLDLTVDPLNNNVMLGGIAATVPEGDQNVFDLSTLGLPFAVRTVAYSRSGGGGYQWSLVGALKLFNQTQGSAAADLVTLTIDNTGRLAGAVNITPNQAIPIVDGTQKLTLNVQRVTGNFDANLTSNAFTFNLGVTAGISLALSTTQTYSASATLTVNERGVQADNITYSTGSATDEFKYLDLAVIQLGLKNLRVPEFNYSQQTGFRFRLLFDAAFRFPDLKNLQLPPIKDIELTNSGFTIPKWEAPNLQLATATATPGDATMTSDGPLDLGGFALQVKAFRMGALSFNWFTGQGPANWGFGFDLELGLGNLVADAPQSLKDMRVQILNAGFSNGRFTGSVEPITFPTPIDLGGVGKIFAISGQLPNAGGMGTPFSLRADLGLDLAAVLPICDGQTKITKPNVTLEIYGDGWVSGNVQDVIPQCPQSAGAFQFQFGQSSIVFGYGNTGPNGARTRTLEMAVAATVRFPSVTEGQFVTASGSVRFDLLQQKWIGGFIDVNAPFKYQPGDNNPYFAFDVNSARLDDTGLHFTGGGSLRAADGAKIGIQFNNFTFALPNFNVTSGSVTFTNSFALGVGIANGALQWGVYSPTAPRPAGSSFRFVAPQQVTIDASGVTINGTATAELQFSDKTYNSLDIAFTSGFKVGFSPVRVVAGRADFKVGQDLIAHIDQNGFWPGNVFGVLPLPAKLGLPAEETAYLVLRDQQNQILIDMQTSPTGLQLRTKPNQSVKLVVPALAQGGAAPEVDVQFDVVVNPATFQFISGFVRAETAPNAQPLFSLAQLGIPLTVRKIAYENVGAGVYGVRLAARFKLPESLNGLDVDVPNLVVTPQGLWGQVDVGSYMAGYTGPAIASASFLGDTLKIEVMGASLKFGSGAAFGLKGQLTSALFKNANEPPAKLKFTASVSEQTGFMLTMDETQGAKLPLAIAFFEPKTIGAEPALRVTANAQDFKVRLTGVVTVPDISPDFAVTIQGLEVGKNGVTFPTISLSGVDQQELDLFGAKFRLRDTPMGNVTHPALKVGVTQGVVSLTLSGEIEFLENTSSFWGFTVATNGTFALAGASLISDPIEIVDDMLSIDKITIENNTFKTEVSVTLPDPLDAPGPQKIYFSINSQGQVTGGADIAVIRQAASFTHVDGSGPNTHFDAGFALIHLRYLGVQLDFGPQFQQNSAVKVVADFYIQNKATNVVKVGDVNGNVVTPGLRIGFDGDVDWGTIVLAGQFDFDFDVVKLTITQVGLAQRDNDVFALSVSGKLALNVSAVSGYLEFSDFTITTAGNVEFSPAGLRGGELAIASVVRIQLSNIAYSGSPTTIQVKKGDGLPKPGQDLSTLGDPSTAMEDVQVQMFISFGGRLSILDVFDGGVQRFLFYKGMDNSTHLLIEKFQVKVMDIIDINGDFKYDEFQGGFEMLLGAEGKIMAQYNIVVVGALAKDPTLASANGIRAGIFLAVRGLTIQIGPYVQIAGLGGGFFLNPRPEWLEYVRVKAKVSQTAGAYIATPPAGFAILLYGEMGLITSAVLKGRMLITIADTFFRIDGYGTILMQDGMLEGDLHIQIAFQEVEVNGNIGFKIKYGGIVEGGGYLNVFVNGQGAWGIDGKAQATVIAMLQANAEVAIGPKGFYFDGKITMGLNIWVIQLEGFMGAKIWYLADDKTFGGYAEVGVKASVLGGVVQATGTLRGAVMIPGQGNAFLFLAASLEASCPFGSWEGWVWAKMQDNQITAGFGQDPTMMAAIDAAKNVASDMQDAKEENEVALGTSKTVTPATVALTDQELIAAYRNIAGWSEGQFFGVKVILEITEVTAQKYLATQYWPIEDNYRGWYYTVLRRDGMPGDSSRVVQYTRDVASAFTMAEQARPQVEARIAALQLNIQSLNPFVANEAALASPIRSFTPAVYAVEEAPKTVSTSIEGSRTSTLDSRTTSTTTTVSTSPTLRTQPRTVMISAPSFEIDQAAATAQKEMLTTIRQTAEANDLLVRQQISALEDGLIKLRAVTTATDAGSLANFAGFYARIASTAERQFASQADLILSRQDWMRVKFNELTARDAAVTSWVTLKTQSLHSGALFVKPTAPCQTEHYTLAKDVARARVRALSVLGGNPQILTEFDQKVSTLTPTTCWDFIRQQMDTSARQLYYHIARAGMTDAIAKADPAFLALGGDANTRLGAIRTAHATLSTALDKLYQVQAEATGALYDLYDRYHFWRTGVSRTPATTTQTGSTTTTATMILAPVILTGSTSAPAAPAAPTVTSLTNMDFVRGRMDALTADLTVPRINNVQVSASNSTRYSTQLQFTWSAWHPSGTYEFRFRDAQAAGATADFLSNGTTGSLTSYKFTPNRNTASSQTRTLDVGVRGGAGFTGFGRTTYTVNFQPGVASIASVSGGGLQADNTPPSTPVVSFLGLTPRTGANGLPEIWSDDPLTVMGTWSADDVESGIGEYEYALWATANGSSVVRPFASAGGRTQVSLERLDLATRPLYVAVRAKNGQGAYSGIGVSPLLRYDPTPPSFAAGASITLAPSSSGGKSVTSTAGSTLQATSGAAQEIGVSNPACPVSMPVLPGTPMGGFLGFLSAAVMSTGTPALPRISFLVPSASDPESGVGSFVYRLTPQRDTVYAGSGWTTVPATTQIVTIEGDPLDYQTQYYVAIAPKNNASSVGKPLTYGPFVTPDRSKPSTPQICAGSAGAMLAVQMQQFSIDDETGVTGYQFRVRTAAGTTVRNWPSSGVDANAGPFNYNVGGLTPVDGTSYLVDVRAVNAQGLASVPAFGGPTLYDASAPPVPSASMSLGAISATQQLIISVNAPNDPHSGLSVVQYAVGSTSGGQELVRWTQQSIVAGASQIITNIPVPSFGATIWLQLRTVNGQGIPSVIGTSSYTVPTPTFTGIRR